MGKKIESTKLEKEIKITLPQRLKDFYDSGEYQRYEDMYFYGLPNFSIKGKFKVRYFVKGFLDWLDDNDIQMPNDDGASYLPFISLSNDEADFLAVDISKDNLCPVAVWSHDTGLFHIHSATLDMFLAKLLKKGEKLPIEKLGKAVEKAMSLQEKNKYLQALDVLKEGAQAVNFEEFKPADDSMDFDVGDTLGDYFSLCGDCYMHTNQPEQALMHYESGLRFGEYNCGLHLISYYLDDKKDYQSALQTIALLEGGVFA